MELISISDAIYTILLNQREGNRMSARKIWTVQQDQALISLIEQQGITKWSQIAHIMTTRYLYPCNQKQCRGRYISKLSKNSNNAPLTSQEEQRVFQLQEQLGNKWTLIASRLNRTDNSVKNYFYATLRRCLRKVNRIVGRYLSKQYHKVETSVLYRIIEGLEHNQLCKSIRDRLRQSQSKLDELAQQEKVQLLREIMGQFSIFEPFLKKVINQDINQSFSSNPSSHHGTINSYNTKSDTHSISQSSKNSQKSEHAQENAPTLGNNFLLRPLKMQRSRSIESMKQQKIEKEEFLFKSLNFGPKKSSNIQPEITSQNYTTEIQDMFGEITINYIPPMSPKISPESSEKLSGGGQEYEQMRDTYNNLWGQMIIPDIEQSPSIN